MFVSTLHHSLRSTFILRMLSKIPSYLLRFNITPYFLWFVLCCRIEIGHIVEMFSMEQWSTTKLCHRERQSNWSGRPHSSAAPHRNVKMIQWKLVKKLIYRASPHHARWHYYFQQSQLIKCFVASSSQQLDCRHCTNISNKYPDTKLVTAPAAEKHFCPNVKTFPLPLPINPPHPVCK